MDGRQRSRRIGAIGTATRVLVGIALLLLAGWSGGFSWGTDWYDLVVGLVALPAISLSAGLFASHHAATPIRFTGPLAICLNCAGIVVLVANPYTSGGALLFYGATLLLAAWRGQPGCEATVVSNLILGRDDQIGCPTFSPIDVAEAKRARRSRRAPTIAPVGPTRGGR